MGSWQSTSDTGDLNSGLSAAQGQSCSQQPSGTNLTTFDNSEELNYDLTVEELRNLLETTRIERRCHAILQRTIHIEECYDPADTTLEFFDADDEINFECTDYKSLRARMSCGHTVTPMSPTNWFRRLLDKGSSGVSTEEEKCYDPADTTLEFVDGDDDMDFECTDYKSLRARMSCGHTVTPMSLTKWCRRLLDKGKSRFVCGQTDCDVEWPYEEVRKMALLTTEETEYFEKKMFQRVAKDSLDVKTCPSCKSSVVRTDLNNLRVRCTLCTADKNKTYEFCWQCLREWEHPSPHSFRCAYDDCISKPLQILKTCPNITFENVKDVTGCPSIRACPTCGLLIEHDKTKCKNIICPRCEVEFCFACLRLTVTV
ncbi:uncharacterized protein LOC130164883 [Seriola aureovittata]|uniref:uncharacterized protein LOC130164883 n=1 Tax=Seriola aureovittata TaxID=2871759 RepID=UPI0024BEBCAD|nr:uncharacterized protein LOC130164883 [Seriola aureovittata]